MNRTLINDDSIKKSNKHVFGILETNKEGIGQKIYRRNIDWLKMGEGNWEYIIIMHGHYT